MAPQDYHGDPHAHEIPPAPGWKRRVKSSIVHVPDSVTGIPEVLDTGTLMINRVMVRLYGVEGTLEPYVANLTAYIRHREVSCTMYGEDTFKCLLDAVDLSELVLLNGASKSRPDAPENLKSAEQQAQDNGVGMWQ